MVTPFHSSMVGSSALFEQFIFHNLSLENKSVRYGINSELNKTLYPEDFNNLPHFRNKKGAVITPSKIDNKGSGHSYSSIVNRFPGAWVKEPDPQIINNGSLIIDLDASLPPYEIIYYKRKGLIHVSPIGSYEFIYGDQTLTWDDYNNITWKKILGKTEHDWDGNLVTIKTKGGKTVTVTDNHSIFGIKKENFTNSINFTSNLIDAGKLKIGDYVVVSDIGKALLEEVSDLKTSHYIGKVYDLSVDETQRFFAGDCSIGCHNTSLYPSMILQSNISFDSYAARIIPPCCHTILDHLDKWLGKVPIPMPQLSSSVTQMLTEYANKEEIGSKTNFVTNAYYVTMYLFQQLQLSRLSLQQIFQPQTTKESILLKTVLIPLLDIFNVAHKSAQKYNQFAYDKIFLPDYKTLCHKYPFIYILYNPNESDSYITKCEINAACEFIDSKIMTFAGTLFEKHETHLGMFTEFLERTGTMRRTYKNKLHDFHEDSLEYSFNNSRQKTVKIVMNTTKDIWSTY